MKTIDYSDINNQIGCGYCKEEKICKIRDSKINKAKLGCKHFKHFSEELNIVENENTRTN